jgi:rod shape determining protein RodA
VLYLAAVGVLVYVLAFGPRIAGTRRWFMGPGGFQVQPSEFAKLVAALLVAKLFAEAKKETLGLFDLLVPGAAVGLMAVLIAAEPDLGTAFTLVPLFLTVAFLAGLRVRAILGVVLVMMFVGSLGWMFALKEYQKSRIYTFLDPNLDPRGAGYQKIQSEIAVGSGGVAGKGYKQGTQSQLGYLPARHTDFIFSVLAEEWGFLGCTVLLMLYLSVLVWGLVVANNSKDGFGSMLAVGVVGMLFWPAVINVAMVLGLAPVIGVPLPLISYGGSQVLANLIALALLMNVSMRRYIF